MNTSASSLGALALVTMLLAATPAASAIQIKSVGEIFVDAQGRASGQNLAGSIDEADGTIQGFRALALGTTLFESISIDGFAASEKISGVGSSMLTLRGTNAVVSLHDNIHSLVKIHATQPTTATYRLAPGVSATQEGASGALVRLTQGGVYVGHIVAVGSESARTRGETITLQDNFVKARLQSGSDLVFLAKPATLKDANYQDALVEALAQGAILSHYITEFEGSTIATSQVDASETAARTRADAAAAVTSTVTTRPTGPTLLAYDLAYETLPARSAADIAVFVDGELAQRVSGARDVLAGSRDNVPRYWATSEGSRTQVLASTPQGGEHRVSVSLKAEASTESQARAEQDGDDDARVYGGFEYHANGKLTGAFLTSVLPAGRAQLLSFTSLASRTEVFKNVSIDGGAAATFHAGASDQMRIETPKADLTLIDDVYATMLLRARSPVDATYTLAEGVHARAMRDDVLLLDGPHGPAGALVLMGEGSLDARDVIHVQLAPGAALVYRGSPDDHESEPDLLAALGDGRLGAQILAGIQAGAAVSKVTSYSQDVDAKIDSVSRGAVTLAYNGASAFALDARGAALIAKGAADVRVIIDGIAAPAAPSASDVLDLGGSARYHATTSADGALRIIINTASRAGQSVDVTIESLVQGSAQAQARTDAFGAFRLFADGSAIGSFVTLKADRAAGAVSGLTIVATGEPVFASLVAGHSPYVTVEGEASSVLRLQNKESRIEVSDTTNGFTKVVALRATDAAFRLATGLHAEQRSQGVVEILAAEGRHVGSLVAASGSTLETRGSEIRAGLAEGGELAFRTHAGIETELSSAQRNMINQAIAAGRVGGYVLIQTQASVSASERDLESTARASGDGLVVGARRAFGEITSAVSASYGDMKMVTSATKQRVDITVSSAATVGKTLIISLDPDTIPGMATGRATIRFDGQLAAQASSYADILDANDDGGVAEYFVLAGDAGTQVLVSIPHFSVHTVTLEQRESASHPGYMYATIILGLLVVGQAGFLAHNARQRKLSSNPRRP